MNNTNSNNNNKRNEWTGGAVAAGVVAALVGGAAYYFTRDSKPKPQPDAPHTQSGASREQPTQSTTESASVSSYLTNMISRMATVSGSNGGMVTPRRESSNVPDKPVITNLNSLLHDIFVRYIQLKDSDFELHYRVFDKIFQDLHKKMKEVDPYYRRYSSTMKKLRDSQGMKKVASYYVKTLFFWEIVEKNDRSFWMRNNPATLFKLMVGRFHAALVAGKIP